MQKKRPAKVKENAPDKERCAPHVIDNKSIVTGVAVFDIYLQTIYIYAE
jgi:hypothetical protein